MEAFLNALSPSVRESTREALARENGEARLRQVVSRYIDEEGNWPTEPTTADYLARAFISRTDDVVASFAPYGLKGPTIAALSVGALSLGKGKALIALGSKLAGKYWVEMTSYAVGVNPALAIAMRGVIGYSTNAADWLGISRKMEGGFDEQVWKDEFADEYASSLERSILGRLAQSAWRGSRSAANHITSKRVGDVSVNEWIENYVAKVARSQADLTVRTARHIVENSLHLPANVMGGRLEQMWALTPHHVDSANKYRAGLEKQDRSASWVNKMTDRYADRLMRQRVDTVAMTEAMTAFNLGRETQWIRSVRDGTLPADTVKMWITGQDEKVCEVCEPMDGKTAPLGEVFEDINLYVPSAHPNCRCIVIPAQLGVASSDEPQLVFPIHDVVEKRTIIIPEYERQDGTTVRRHTRVVGERDAMERWKEAEPTEEHAAIAKVMRNLRNDLWDSWFEGHRARPDPPESMKNVNEFDHWEDYNEWWRVWSTEGEGKTWWQEVKAVDRRQRAKREKEMIPKLEAVADPDLVKSIIRGSRIWSTQTGGIGLVRELAGLTAPNHIPSEDYNRRKWRESEIKAASDFLNTVRSAPLVNNRVFYRGIDIPHTGPFKKELKQSLKKIKPGQIIDLPVSSVTEKRHTAEAFMDMFERSKPSTKVLFKINKGSPSLRLPNPISNPLFEEHEWVVSGRFEIDSVEQQEKWGADFLYVTLNYAGDSVSKSVSDVIDEIESRLGTPLVPPETARLFDDDDISKRTITVREYTRSDGTVVEEHQRKIDPASPSSDSGSGSSSRILSGFTDARVREFLENFSRDGELTYHEATALGTMAAAAIALGSRGRIRRGMNPTIYDEMGLLPSGQLVVPPKLMESLRKTYTYKSPNSGLRTEIKSINVETAPHHTYAGQRLHEMLGGQADMPALLRGKQTLRGRVADRYLVKRDNIFVEAQVVNPQGRTVGRFETTIDPRTREVFQDGFFMDSNYQGSGFSGEFTAHIGMRYVETGIDSIGVFAGGPVGGYAWASRGFGWRYGPSKDVLKRLSEAQRRTDLYPEPVLQEIRDVRRKMLLGLGTGKFPTPQEISKIGNQVKRVEAGSSTSASARQTWAGKDIMLGSNWHASLNIREVRRLLRKEGVIKLLSPRHLSLLSVGSRA